MYLAVCVVVFLVAYLINALVITVGYHRGLAHGAVELHPVVRRGVIGLGNWLTGLDPKAWAVMHRLHHAHSDTALDPHSPHNVGIAGILFEQLQSYKRVLVALARDDERVRPFAKGLDFDLNILNRYRVWWLPYVVHGAVALALGALGGLWLLGLAYFVGIMSHPLQGGLVNAFGHAVGGRNFDTRDQSTNNHVVAWLVAGEGFQNNHHAHPASARFSYRASEVDWGYGACRVLQAMGALRIDEAHLLKKKPSRRQDSTSLHAAGPAKARA